MKEKDINNRVSVIMTVHNGEKYIEESINSILSQTLKVYEIIVINDGSTDATTNILAKFKNEVLVLHQSKSGIAVSWNKGVGESTGNFISFLDADDYWPAYKIERQMKTLQISSASTISFGYVKQFYSPELSKEERALKRCPDRPEPGFSSGCMLINKEDFMNVGLFKPKWEKGIFSDWFLRAKDMGMPMHMDESIFLYRRIHLDNHGILKREKYNDYVRMLKESLGRRRS